MTTREMLRSGAWATAARLNAYWVAVLGLEIITGIYVVLRSHGILLAPEQHLSTEFISFYAAGRLALTGDAAHAYDPSLHEAMEHAIAGDPKIGYFAFFYPPVYLLICTLLARLPYYAAFGLWVGATLALFLTALRAIFGQWRLALMAIAYPAIFETAAVGENGLLTAALYGFGTASLARHPALAGSILGALCIKPHFAGLALLALCAGRCWRAAFAMCLSMMALIGLSVVIFGTACWILWFHVALRAAYLFEAGAVSFDLQVTPFAAVRELGGGIAWARFVEAMTGIAAALTVMWIWWRRDGAIERRAASLAIALPLCVPVMLDYDLTIPGIGFAWLVRRGLDRGFDAWEKTLLALAFMLPMVSRSAGIALHVPIAATTISLLLTRVATGISGKAR